MTPLELVMKAFDTEAGWDLLDNLTVLRLKESRDLFIKERDRLDTDRGMDHLTQAQLKDWECLVMDIAAINRVLEVYGVYNEQ